MGISRQMGGSPSSLEGGSPRASPIQSSQLPSQLENKRSSPVSAAVPAAEPRPPARDRTGARKALLQWAQTAAKE